MKNIYRISLVIDNFDNDAIKDNDAEVARIIRKMSDRVETLGLIEAFKDRRLMDINGNQVGKCQVFFK